MPTRKIRDDSARGWHWQEYGGYETWQQQEARKLRARRVAHLEALLIWEGHNPRDPLNLKRLAFRYRPDQQDPTATFKRWRRQEEAQMLVDHELAALAQANGITQQTVLQQLAELPTRMKTDSGLIESIKMQARLVGVPVERQTLVASISRTDEWLIEDAEFPALPEHIENE